MILYFIWCLLMSYVVDQLHVRHHLTSTKDFNDKATILSLSTGGF